LQPLVRELSAPAAPPGASGRFRALPAIGSRSSSEDVREAGIRRVPDEPGVERDCSGDERPGRPGEAKVAPEDKTACNLEDRSKDEERERRHVPLSVAWMTLAINPPRSYRTFMARSLARREEYARSSRPTSRAVRSTEWVADFSRLESTTGNGGPVFPRWNRMASWLREAERYLVAA